MRDLRHIPILLAWLSLALGIALRIRQLTGRSDLWLDEVVIALNITRRSWSQLVVTPLAYDQVCPPLFLQAAKLSTVMFGTSEFAFRLPSLVFSILGLLIFAKLTRRFLSDWERVIAILLVAAAPMLLIYSAELKQYSADVFAAVLVSLVAFKARKSGYSKGWTIASALCGLAIVWLSDPSSFVLAGVGVGLLALAIVEGDRIAQRRILLIAPVWTFALFAQYWTARMRTAGGTAETMQKIWRDSFLPVIPRSAHEAGWLGRAITDIYSQGFGLPTANGFCTLLMLLGLIGLWRSKRRDVVVIFFGPVIVALIASGAHLYPFSGRVILFLFPAFAIALAAGVLYVSKPFKTFQPAVAIGLFALVIAPQVDRSLRRSTPWITENITPVLAYVSAHRHPNDKIYVVWSAAAAVDFYGPRYGISSGEWATSAWPEDRTQLDSIWKDIDTFRGADRLWVIFAHDHPASVRDRILSHLDSLGTPIYKEEYPGRRKPREDTSAFLYNMRTSE